MKLYSMRRPKRKPSKDTLEASLIEEPYPYGLQLSFETEEVEKIPALKKVKPGEKVRILGEGIVTGVRISEDRAKKRHSVTVQLQVVGLASKEDYGMAWEEAMGRRR